MSANGPSPIPPTEQAVECTANADSEQTTAAAARHDEPDVTQPEFDDFGLPITKTRRPIVEEQDSESDSDAVEYHEAPSRGEPAAVGPEVSKNGATGPVLPSEAVDDPKQPGVAADESTTNPAIDGPAPVIPARHSSKHGRNTSSTHNALFADVSDKPHAAAASEWSHQQLAPQAEKDIPEAEEDAWQDMPAYAPYAIYDDNNKLVAKEAVESDDEQVAYGNLGGAGKGYTRVQLDEDAQSATSMDDNTAYLFKESGNHLVDEDDDARDPLSQMQTTKNLLTEGQRIAYVGVVRLAMIQMVKDLEGLEKTKGAKKEIELGVESMKMWSQKMMVRLYSHMEVDSAEQVMIEQLAEHDIRPEDLTSQLMQNSRVKNPNAEETVSGRPSISSPQPGASTEKLASCPATPNLTETPPPPYADHEGDDLPEVRTPSQLPDTKNIDIDLRWTILCDLFLVLIADSVYDSRSRQLLERVGASMSVPWLEICRFEKRVIDALEMQEAASKENWNEEEHMQNRKRMARNRRLVMMGLATVGGSLVIGLSAGLLAPVIGAGLAAGFTTIGVAGTGGFLAGAGGAALVTTTGVLAGGTIAVRASDRRTGAVKTFEYSPLHNNKRVNLIVTVAGWMNGKVDDVRLPYSTVDPIMGDIYSVLWEPEMLRSMGATINILATEALTQGLQQVLGSTILTALMAAITLPVVLTKLSYLIDNPWNVSLARADMAGLILADSLIDRNLGVRPVTLVGFSLGSRVIFACLRELAARGAYGLVQNAYLFGSPIVAKKDEYLRVKSVVPGRFVNGYATNDWILGYLFRATGGGIMRVAGLAPVEVQGIENVNVTEFVNGHMAYRAAMPRLLREVGWVVESDEFAEIEDPDPDNHEKRQRELINEIEEARKALEKKPEKKRFGLFKSKKAEKKEWETYDERAKTGLDAGPRDGVDGKDAGVLFDIDAIRREAAEFAAEGIQIKEIKSTLPPMKIETKSFDNSSKALGQESYAGNLSLPLAPNGHNTVPPTKSQLGTANGYDDYDELNDGDNNISMTFDTSYQQSPLPSYSRSPVTSSATSPIPQQDSWTSPSLSDSRPPLRSATTMPTNTFNMNPEHNAWADDEDEFGQEREIKMTFA
ncbi:hypothetical protein H2199_001209 [Coniosporium tulheliwenetii]|uniref:Uncharacterized protein n=1 Tax=Coniosporium tulheliwenetii TaxID=3383036 RepID=A0ACC2ZLI5_9PEZI|nr:hypothetical protein H2199_001209 [Cladosporium sp. JES 115]